MPKAPNYVVEQNDSSAFSVVDRRHRREYCLCNEFEGGSNPKRRAERIASLLNDSGASVSRENKAWANAIATRICDELHMGLNLQDSVLLEKVLAESLANTPAEMRRLIGTGVIEEGYFESLPDKAKQKPTGRRVSESHPAHG